MDEKLIKERVANELAKARSDFARQGGLARAKALTPKQRQKSAINASRAAAKARTRAARERKKQANV